MMPRSQSTASRPRSRQSRQSWLVPDRRYYRTPRQRFNEWGWRVLTLIGMGAMLYGAAASFWAWLTGH
jgi:hypothetical protein